ncbi:septum formation initiator [Streptomyces sp. 549]|uniref:septum site-determining protein Ssd n=1 Tax=Streptomyces sp. 549 TaxID=3049076 RepID=UPI0024C3E323|nr:septum site-determining protein Ssd [Streptomyces sp. 549]MDK1476341.1 septum formation initiator [Streptomyces sp. 549]
MAQTILIVTEDAELLDDLLRLCAAAGAEAHVAPGGPVDDAQWRTAPLVLVGDDRAEVLARASGPSTRRPGVLLLGRDLDDHGVWQRGVGIGAEHVVFLPDAEPWLTGRIADAAEGAGRQGVTIGVIGGRGGAGASTLATALAVAAGRTGRRSLLVDADPLGGGLDVLLGGESAEGLRWPAFTDSRGRVAAAALEESLPSLHGVRVLSWDRGTGVAVPPEAMRSVLGAARRGGGAVVVDLPRRTDEPVGEALSQLDLGLLVVPAEVRAVAAAHRLATRLNLVLKDLRVVVRGPRRAGLGDEQIARLLELPLAGQLPDDPGLLESVERGVPPGSAPGSPLAAFCAALWERTLPGENQGSVTA